MPEKISEETKNLVIQFQTYQQQLQTVLIQKESLKLQAMEVEKALEELKESKEKKAYKIVGQVMVLKPVEELEKELNETKENINIRIKSLEKTEERLSNKLKELQEELKTMVK